MDFGGRVITIQKGVKIPLSEVRLTFSRSGGPGGQHVNKVETGVTLIFDVGRSPSLSTTQKTRILTQLGGRIDKKGLLRVSEKGERSQWRNRELVMERFVELVRKALRVQKTRLRTAPSRSARMSRLHEKKIQAGKKKERRRPSPDSG